jgi:Uma2 family endonuclease
MTNAQPHENLVSEDEFLIMIENSPDRLELQGGRVYAMAGGELSHSQLIDNLATVLKLGLRGKSCRAIGSSFHVKVENTGDWFIPDNAIYCVDARFVRHPRRGLLDPVVIFEVSSPSTEKYDRTQKFDLYKKIESLRDYVLISMDFVRVEHFSRQSNGWLLQTFTRLDETVELPSVELTIAISELYDELDVPVQLSLIRMDPELEIT